MKRSPIKFRKAALKRISTPEQLNQLIRITSPKSWLILLTVVFILIAVVIWGFLGTIPTRVEGKGILLFEKENLYAAVMPAGTGRLVKLNFTPGDSVKKGEVIAVLENPQLAEEIKVSKGYLRTLQQKYTELAAMAKQKIAERKKELMQKNKVLKRIITAEIENLKQITELLRVRQQSLKRGLETKQGVVETLRDYYNSKRQIENSRNELMQNKINEANFIDQWKERLRELDLKIRDTQHQLENLKARLKTSAKIRSPVDGIVTNIQKSIGSIVKEGETVLSIAVPSRGMDAVIYITSQDAKRVKPQMEALVSPATVKKEEFGSIKGKVISVSQYPMTKEAMIAILQNEDLVSEFLKEGTPIAVRIRLQQDSKTLSGFAWSSSQGPDQKITPGTLAIARITVREQPPAALIIPAIRKLLGLE